MLYRVSIGVFLLAWLGLIFLEPSPVPWAPLTPTTLLVRIPLLFVYVFWHGGLILSATGWGERHRLVTAFLLLPFSLGILAHFMLHPLSTVEGAKWPPPNSEMREALFIVSVPLYLLAFFRIFWTQQRAAREARFGSPPSA